MHDPSFTQYQRFILNKIIIDFETNNDINIYELVKTAVSNKHVLASQNALIMETYYSLKEYLVDADFLIENKEMSSYTLTEKGRRLKVSHTIEEFEKKELKKERRSLISMFFS